MEDIVYKISKEKFPINSYAVNIVEDCKEDPSKYWNQPNIKRVATMLLKSHPKKTIGYEVEKNVEINQDQDSLLYTICRKHNQRVLDHSSNRVLVFLRKHFAMT